ncbi:MAG: hypothetical protein J6S30_00630 [Kiritimatiellae bacterium]|nr:hypothetical protein [Kiritimatiellia bacterium]
MKSLPNKETISFDSGISLASFVSGDGFSPFAGEAPSVLPGSMGVVESLEEMFPRSASVTGEIMSALVSGNNPLLRTREGFNAAARSALSALKARGSLCSRRAAAEIESLIDDTEIFEAYRSALFES